MPAPKCCNAYVKAAQANPPAPAAGVAALVVPVNAPAAATVAVETAVAVGEVQTAVVSFSRHAPKGLVRHRAKAVAVDPVHHNLLVLPASRAHPARRQANRIPCAPVWT